MKITIIAVLLMTMISGCKTMDNYEFGDVTKTALNAANKIIQLKAEYCAETNQLERQMILTTIRLVDADYDGVCE